MRVVELEKKGATPTALRVKGLRQELKQIRGLYLDPYKTDSWGVMPLTPLSLEILKGLEIKYPVSAEVAEWFNNEMKFRTRLAEAYEHSAHCRDERLYDFQRRAASFMIHTDLHEGRVLLADDPRLGKTIQSLWAMEHLVQGQNSLHIFTLKALKEYWAEQVEKWTTFEPVIVEGSAAERSVLLNKRWGRVALITNWETLRMVKPNVLLKNVKNLIGDECHVTRNRGQSKISEAFMKLRPVHAILASATMIERGPQDYFALLRVLRPKEFASYWRFVGWYCETEFNGFGNNIIGAANHDLLADHLAPFSMRRRAGEVTDLPDKQFQDIHITPSMELMIVYKQLEEEVFVEINSDKTLVIPNALARMVRLRQVSTAPRTLGFDFDSPKVEAVREYVESLPDDIQVVVYTSFRECAKQLVTQIPGASLFIGGEGSTTTFKLGLSRVLVTTPQVGGVGQDFSMAKIIIYADLPLSATLIRQSIERATKIGQTDPRLIVTFSCTPIDTAMAETLKAKQDTIEDVDLFEAILKYRITA